MLAGSLATGSKLKIEDLQDLQDLYGFSSSPLREALSRLCQEGLVRADERRGFRVAPISAEDMADTRMRLILDLQALSDAISCGTDAWEAAIVAAFYRLEKVEGSSKPEGLATQDERAQEADGGDAESRDPRGQRDAARAHPRDATQCRGCAAR